MSQGRVHRGVHLSCIGLSCLYLAACTVTETPYVNTVADTATHDYGEIENALSKNVILSTDQDATVAAATNGADATAIKATGPHGEAVVAATQLDFYRSYGDSKLSALIEQVLEQNYELKTAYLNLRQAELSLEQSRINYHPTGNVGVNASVRENLSDTQGDRMSHSVSSSASLSYEVDLFGRLAADERSSYEQFKASAYDYKAMRLTLIQRTSEYYWNYAYAREALKMAQDQLKNSQRRLDLIKVMWDNGASDGLEYDQALANHRSVEQMVYQRKHELTAARNALTTLLGEYTEQSLENKIKELALEKTKTPQIVVSLPASLLRQRPDLMAYEARLRAAYADVDLREASFYPTFTLNAGISGGSSDSLLKFLSDPVGSLGAALAFPFVNYNELRLQKESALLARDQARLNFAQGFITAVEEVANALNDLSYQGQLIRSVGSEFELSKSNYARYLERYSYGSASITEVLDASDSLRSAETRLLSSKRDLLNAAMNLMVALGGDSFTAESVKAATASTVSTVSNASSASNSAANADTAATTTITTGTTGDAANAKSAAYDPEAILQQAKQKHQL